VKALSSSPSTAKKKSLISVLFAGNRFFLSGAFVIFPLPLVFLCFIIMYPCGNFTLLILNPISYFVRPLDLRSFIFVLIPETYFHYSSLFSLFHTLGTPVIHPLALLLHLPCLLTFLICISPFFLLPSGTVLQRDPWLNSMVPSSPLGSLHFCVHILIRNISTWFFLITSYTAKYYESLLF
jgi:hypothetical protein